MNYMAVGAALILLLFTVRGAYLGMVRTVFSTFGFIIAIALAANVSPVVSETLDHSPAHTVVYDNVYKALFEKTDSSSYTEEDPEEVGQENSTQSVIVENEVIDSLPLPSFIKETMKQNNNPDVYELLGINAFQDYVAESLTMLILKALGYIIIFLIVTVFLKIAVTALDLVAKLPVLRTFNKAGGILFGIVNGLVVLWIICIILMIISGTEIAQTAYTMINDSTLLRLIYNSNPLLRPGI